MLDIFIHVSSVLLPVFLIMGLGAYFVRTKILTEQGNDNIKAMVYKVLMPIMVFTYLVKNPVSLTDSLEYIKVSVIYITVLSAVLYGFIYMFLYRCARLAILSTSAFTFPNNVYLGVPVCLFAFGDSAILPAIIMAFTFFVVPFYVLIVLNITETNTTSHLLRRIWGAFWGVMSNPILVGIPFALIFIYLDIHLPVIVDRTFILISDANKMLALMSVGASLYSIYLHKEPFESNGKVPFRIELILACTLKLILMPALSILVVSWIDAPPMWKAVFILQSAMPLGVVMYFIACEQGVYVRRISVHVLTSTLMSMLILPIWIVILWDMFYV